MDYPKRLIEVDLPIKQISAHARREKSIRHGHISTLHIWWARRPLAACRAVLCAALWPDPADDLCPQEFRDRAAEAILAFARKASTGRLNSSEKALGEWLALARTENPLDPADPNHLNTLRYLLLDFIADFANWDNSTVPEYLETARALTQAAHEALGGEPGTRPLVVDPFAGGGAIPLEALRVGADAFASDLNPVAVLLNKVVLEYIPKYGQTLADEVRRWGAWIKQQAEAELAGFYPPDEDGATPIAYLWARTITCEGPNCGAEVPLMRSFWLSKKASRSVALKLLPDQQNRRVDFEIVHNPKAKEVGEGTVRRGSATCPVCGYTTPVASVRAQLKTRRGGAADARLIAVRYDDPKTEERAYRLSTELDLDAARRAADELERRRAAHTSLHSLVPDEPLPPQGTLGFRVQLYGMEQWGDLFTPRQALALTTLARLVRQAGEELAEEHDRGLATAVQTCLALALDRLADFNSSLCVLNATGGRGVVHTFGRQALPIVWDFMETNPFNEVGANWIAGVDAFETTIGKEAVIANIGYTNISSAAHHSLPDDSSQCFFTDPPYYDAVPYADLSDFFIVWLNRTAGDKHPQLFRGELAPKEAECIVDEVKGKDRAFFERTMTRAMAEGRRVLGPSGMGLVVFAHKSTSGWEAMLQSMIDAGWTITGSWPIDTERPGRLRAHESAALASSIHLVCRPREDVSGSVTATVGDWRDVLAELPQRIHDWLPRLSREGVVGADAIFACLGPALEIFSRYARVEKASGEPVTLRDYLEHVWAAVSREALGMIFKDATASGFEEDARLTAMWLWTLSTSGNGNGGETESEDESAEDDEESAPTSKTPTGYSLEYDAARKIAQGLGAHLERLPHLVEVKGSTARLLPVAARARHLLGKEPDAVPTSDRPRSRQLSFLEVLGEDAVSEWGDDPEVTLGASILDRLHQAMLLFAAGRGEALRSFVVSEGVGRDARFWSLAQAFSALYPPGTDEKRWVDGVLARKKSFGF